MGCSLNGKPVEITFFQNCTVLYCTVPDKLENTFRVSIDFTAFPFTKQLIIYIINLFPHTQGYNARKVISEV